MTSAGSTYRLVGNVVPMDGPGFATPTFHNFPANSLWIQDIGESDVVHGFLRIDPPLDLQNTSVDSNFEQHIGQPAVYIFYGIARRYIDTKDGLEAALREEFSKLRDLPYLQRTIGRFIDDPSLIAEANAQIAARNATRAGAPDKAYPIDLSSASPTPSRRRAKGAVSGGARVVPLASAEPYDDTKAYATTALELLRNDVTYPGWEYSLGKTNSFYIRGATWFHRNFGSSISELMEVRLDDLKSTDFDADKFLTPDFDWKESYSSRQAIKGLSIRNRAPLKFPKAVQTILLCYCALARRTRRKAEISPDEVFKHMRIEPACFYLRDFDRYQLSEFERREPGTLDLLREMTSQRTRVVFSDMAHGHTVSRALAERTANALARLFPDQPIGGIDYRYQPGRRPASTSEVLED